MRRVHSPLRPRLRRTVLLAVLLAPNGLSDIQSTTQSLSATISPYGKFSLAGAVPLVTSGTRFASFTGSLMVNYWARTADGGSGSITVQASSEFSPAGGPSVASVSYTCAAATLGTACSGTQVLSTVSQSSVLSLPGGVCTGGGGACSASDPNSVQLNFVAPNKAQYKTGSYSASITFTITTL